MVARVFNQLLSVMLIFTDFSKCTFKETSSVLEQQPAKHAPTSSSDMQTMHPPTSSSRQDNSKEPSSIIMLAQSRSTNNKGMQEREPNEHSEKTTDANPKRISNEEFKALIVYLNLEKEMDDIFTLLNAIRVKAIKNAKKHFCPVTLQHVERRKNAFASFDGSNHGFNVFGSVTQIFEDNGSKYESETTNPYYDDPRWELANVYNFSNLASRAVVAGNDGQHNSPVWVIRGRYSDEADSKKRGYFSSYHVPGTLLVHSALAYIHWYKQHILTEFEVLTVPNRDAYEWKSWNQSMGSPADAGALVGSWIAWDKALYIARVPSTHATSLHKNIVGSVWWTGVNLMYGYHGKHYPITTYDLLIRKTKN